MAGAAPNAALSARENTDQSWLARQMPEAAKPVAMLGLIERLKHVRAVGLDPTRGDGDTSGVSLDRRFHGYSLSEIRNPCYALNHDGPNGNRTKGISPPVGRSSVGGANGKKLKGTLLVWSPCNPLKSYKTAKGIFGKAWRETR
jgi:hypothetical protein